MAKRILKLVALTFVVGTFDDDGRLISEEPAAVPANLLYPYQVDIAAVAEQVDSHIQSNTQNDSSS